MVEADRVIDELFRDRPNQKIDKQRMVDAAASPIAPDVMTYFIHLRDQSFTKSALINALNSPVKARHHEPASGLIGVGAAEKEAKRQRGQKQA